MQFIVVGRQEIEQGVIVRQPYAVISISDPDKPRPRILKTVLLRGSLFLRFHDVEDQMRPDIVMMKPAQARRIWRFVEQQAPEIGALVVQCEQGASRSPAVAAAICKTLGGDDSRFFQEYVPNRYVYDLMLKTAPAR